MEKEEKNKCWYTSYFVRWVLYLRDSMQKLWILLKMQTKEHNSFWFKCGAESDRINRECAFYVLCTSSVMSVYAFCLLFTTNNERNVWNLLLENILSRTFFWLLSVFFHVCSVHALHLMDLHRVVICQVLSIKIKSKSLKITLSACAQIQRITNSSFCTIGYRFKSLYQEIL